MSDDWASEFAAKLRKKQQDRVGADQLMMQSRGMITSHAPILWDSLRETINEKAKAVNLHGQYFTITSVIQGITQHALESPDHHLLLTFDYEVPIVKFRLTKGVLNARAQPEQVKGDLTFQAFGGEVWFTNKNGNRMGSAEAAEFFLEMHS